MLKFGRECFNLLLKQSIELEFIEFVYKFRVLLRKFELEACEVNKMGVYFS